MSVISLNPPNEQPITEMFAYVSIDQQGNEGLCATFQPPLGNIQLVFGYERIARLFMPLAEKMAREGNKTIRLVKFSAREELVVFGAKI